MKKIIWSSILLLVAIGVAIWASFDFKGFPIIAEEGNSMNKIINEDVSKIYLEIDNKPIEITASNDENYYLDYTESKFLTTTYSFKDGELILTQKQKRIFSIFNWGIQNHDKVTLKIPTKFSGELKGLSSNASINATLSNTMEKIELKTSNAQINAKDFISSSCDFQSSNGDVTIHNTSCLEGVLHVETSNSDVTVSDTNCPELVAESSNGNIVISHVKTNEITAETSNSSIEYYYNTANKIVAETSNGRINGSNNEIDVMQLTTSNSRVELSLLGEINDYKLYAKTSNSSVEIGNSRFGNEVIIENDATKIVDVETSNGSILVDFNYN